MNDQDVEWRANDAKALLENPLLKDIFEQYERSLLDRALSTSDDQEKIRLLVGIEVCRMVKRHLAQNVFDGKIAAKLSAEIANGQKFL